MLGLALMDTVLITAGCYGLNCPNPANSQVEALSTMRRHLDMGLWEVLRFQWGHGIRALIMGSVSLQEGTTELFMRGYSKKVMSKAREKPLTQTQFCWHLNLKLFQSPEP